MISERAAEPSSASSNPYVFWVPPAAQSVSSVHKSDIDQIKSVTTAKLDQKVRTNEFIRTKLSTTQAYQEANLRVIIKAFRSAAIDGHVSRAAFGDVIHSLSPLPAVAANDSEFLDETFNAISGNSGKGLDFVAFVNSLFDAVNGSKAAETAHSCFAVLDTSGCGSLLRKDLEAIRESRTETAGVTHLMARHLIALIDSSREAAADAYVKAGPKQRKALASGTSKAALQTQAIHQVFEEKAKADLDAAGEREKASDKALRAKQAALPPPRAPHIPFCSKTSLSRQEFAFLMLNDAILVQAFTYPIIKCIAQYAKEAAVVEG